LQTELNPVSLDVFIDILTPTHSKLISNNSSLYTTVINLWHQHTKTPATLIIKVETLIYDGAHFQQHSNKPER